MYELFRLELADFIIITVRLPHVQFRFEADSVARAADIGRRNMVEMPDSCGAAQLEDVPRAREVRKVGFGLASLADECETRRVVHDSRAVPRDPIQRFGRQAQLRLGEIA